MPPITEDDLHERLIAKTKDEIDRLHRAAEDIRRCVKQSAALMHQSQCVLDRVSRLIQSPFRNETIV